MPGCDNFCPWQVHREAFSWRIQNLIKFLSAGTVAKGFMGVDRFRAVRRSPLESPPGMGSCLGVNLLTGLPGIPLSILLSTLYTSPAL
ncbi:hypothetical protein JTE90_005833 [Oedothorax gibbosus]|uniref:Uncharacterized protein n=1 Tax=Oedothorax gibbosus TaxID=931172 RepID=A0AAV6V1Z2_9ARAC|nr:hypothetical protein JTE90_005833 [Oedothorax gibbosus]